MLRTLCLILLTAFLICNATDVTRFLLAKEKVLVACEDTGNGNGNGDGEDARNSKDTNNNTGNSTGNCDDTGTCDHEKTEFEKINDDQLLISHSVYFDKANLSIPLKSSFFYTVSFRNEIYRYIFSPPPELV